MVKPGRTALLPPVLALLLSGCPVLRAHALDPAGDRRHSGFRCGTYMIESTRELLGRLCLVEAEAGRGARVNPWHGALQ
jgi:hypothetical protein